MPARQPLALSGVGVLAAAGRGLDNPLVELWGLGFLFVAGSERIRAAITRGGSARVWVG